MVLGVETEKELLRHVRWDDLGARVVPYDRVAKAFQGVCKIVAREVGLADREDRALHGCSVHNVLDGGSFACARGALNDGERVHHRMLYCRSLRRIELVEHGCVRCGRHRNSNRQQRHAGAKEHSMEADVDSALVCPKGAECSKLTISVDIILSRHDVKEGG